MRFKGLLLFSFLLAIAVVPAFAQYEGGDNDGSGVAAAGCVTTLDGIDQFSFGTLTGPPTFCDFSNEAFTISLNDPPQDIQFYWTVPGGATIVSGNNTSTIGVAFGNTPGIVSVTVVTACTSQTFNLPVTNGTCTMYQGDGNDGFTQAPSCTTTLNGDPLINIAPAIAGSPDFCVSATESYSIQVDNAPSNTYYLWSVPAGSVVTSGQGSNTIIVTFDGLAGNVSVDVIMDCGTTTRTIAVSPMNCPFYAGGDNDGFSEAPSCTTTLDGAPLIDIAPAIVGSVDFCEGATESYSIQVDNAPANTYYNWTVPVGAIVQNGQGTNTVIIFFGSASGNVSVDIITDCSTTNRSMAVSPVNCVFYAGGDNDGFSETPSCSTDLDGGPTFSVVGISGSSTFCEFGNESFTTVTVNAPANTYYSWTVPAGATILSGQGTSTILVAFGNTSGDVGVTITTDCTVITPPVLTVTVTSCSFYAGGNNDGFSSTTECATKLDGTAALVVGSIIGSTSFCDFATESYSINPQGANIQTSYLWSVPAGATIISGQGTTTILVAFANSGGNISVDVTNQCTTINATQPVSSTSCIFYAGGNNDGFSSIQQCASNLDGGSVFVPGPIVGTATSCNFSTESYSITVAGALANTVYNWTVPAGASIISGQGTTSILVAFAANSGNIAVSISNECETINVSQPVSIGNCIFYAGGNNDGFSSAQQCASNLNGGSVFVPGPIVGTPDVCSFSTESYSITVAGAIATTGYLWSVPAGAAIISGQGTSTILVAFANNSGNVSVDVINPCETITVSQPVIVGNCIFYAGGNNDGFSFAQQCASNLNGGSVFAPGAIAGPPSSCNFSTESYSITVAGATSTTGYLWSVPAGTSIISGQGTSSIFVAFGNTNGNIAVAVSNLCETINVSLAVTVGNCIFYSGGNNDGFSVTTITNMPLPISLVSFDASVNNGIVYLTWETQSEIDNDFFVIERSKDGKKFEALTKIDGAGTSREALKYQAKDTDPYNGTSYYRLSQTDFDGSINYYKVLAVKIEGFAEVTRLYPNPVERDALLHVDFFAEEDGEVKISIVDPAGLSTESDMIKVTAGVNLFEFTPHFKSAGVHVIIIRSKEKVQALRLVVL